VATSLSTNISKFIASVRNDRKRLIYVVISTFIIFFILRSCILDAGNSLPSAAMDKIQKQYVVCISPEDTPIWPGEPRQPECGTVEIKVVGEGTVPEKQKSEGITKAICYQVRVQNPFWSTQGTTRHEVKWSARTANQVTIFQNGTWEIFPDQEQENEQRWQTYSCPDS
jgi:hypothetical protein